MTDSTESENLENGAKTPNLTIVPSEVNLVLKSPTPSVSPRVISSSAKSLRTSSTLSAFAETDRLAASLHHGLEVIDKHRKSSILGRSSFRFSYKPVEYEPKPVKKEVGVQTVSQKNEFLCSNCKSQNSEEVKDTNDGSNLQLVPVDGSSLVDDNKSKQLVVPKV